MPGRGSTELIEVFRGRTLAVGAPTSFQGQDFPYGEAWYRLLLRINLALVVGTGTGALSEALYRIVNAIQFQTDRSEIICNAIPARPLIKLATIKAGTPPDADTFAAASATYSFEIPIWFADPLMMKPEDTILDTRRYNSVVLRVTMGTVADLLSTPGTASYTATLDCYVDRSKGRLPDEAKPLLYPEYGFRGPVDPTAVLSIDLERAADLSYKRILSFYGVGTTQAGKAFSGDPSGVGFNDLTLDDGATPPILNQLFDQVQRQNRGDYSLETKLTGWSIEDFVRDGSVQSALFSGDRSRLTQKWTVGTLGATPQVAVAYDGYRVIR